MMTKTRRRLRYGCRKVPVPTWLDPPQKCFSCVDLYKNSHAPESFHKYLLEAIPTVLKSFLRQSASTKNLINYKNERIYEQGGSLTEFCTRCVLDYFQCIFKLLKIKKLSNYICFLLLLYRIIPNL